MQQGGRTPPHTDTPHAALTCKHRCVGPRAGLGLQATALAEHFVALTAPWAALTIDFEHPPASTIHTRVHTPAVCAEGVAHCVLFWWDLHLTDTVVLSTAPGWARSPDGAATSCEYRPTTYVLVLEKAAGGGLRRADAGLPSSRRSGLLARAPARLPSGPPSYGWRDHWMQAVCFLPYARRGRRAEPQRTR